MSTFKHGNGALKKGGAKTHRSLQAQIPCCCCCSSSSSSSCCCCCYYYCYYCSGHASKLGRRSPKRGSERAGAQNHHGDLAGGLVQPVVRRLTCLPHAPYSHTRKLYALCSTLSQGASSKKGSAYSNVVTVLCSCDANKQDRVIYIYIYVYVCMYVCMYSIVVQYVILHYIILCYVI